MHVYQVLAPAKFGGAETVCLSLAAALGAADVRCTLVMLVGERVPGELIERAERLRLHTLVLRHGRRGYYRDAWALCELVRRERDAVLHAHLARANLVVRAAATLTRRPCVATYHGHSGVSVRDRVHDHCDRSVLRSMDAVFSVSRSGAAALLTRTPRLASRCAVVPSALLPEAALPRATALDELGVVRDATILGWAGRFVSQKHPELFVRTVAELDRRGSLAHPWQAAMVGDGPLLGTTRELANALGVADRIVFSGFRRDAGRLVSAFDALVLTSRGEELPTVMLECLCRGVPVVSTAVGDVPHVAAQCGAVRLAGADPERFADVIAELFSASTSRDELATLGRSYIAAHHAPAAWAQRHRELYQQLLHAR